MIATHHFNLIRVITISPTTNSSNNILTIATTTYSHKILPLKMIDLMSNCQDSQKCIFSVEQKINNVFHIFEWKGKWNDASPTLIFSRLSFPFQDIFVAYQFKMTLTQSTSKDLEKNELCPLPLALQTNNHTQPSLYWRQSLKLVF